MWQKIWSTYIDALCSNGTSILGFSEFHDIPNFSQLPKNAAEKILKYFWCCRCKSTEENRPNLKIWCFSCKQKYTDSRRKMKQQKKMQSNLSKESLRKDIGHFLEITQGPFQRKALPLSVLY